MSADERQHSRHGHRHWHWRINYADLNVGSRPQAEEPDPAFEQFRMLQRHQRSLVTKTIVINLLSILAAVACVWLGGRWILSQYPPPDETAPAVRFGH
jgi:hypothetical protein